MLGMILENAEWDDLEIEVDYSKSGIENITVSGREPKGHEIDMIAMSLREIEESIAWQIHYEAKEREHEDRMFLGRVL